VQPQQLVRQADGGVPLGLHERADVALLEQHRRDAQRVLRAQRRLQQREQPAQYGGHARVVGEPVAEEVGEVGDRVGRQSCKRNA
jgi:hypothetical protein